jgi:uncharacterized protein YqeY
MLRNRLNDSLKEAMKSQDQIGVSTLRLVLAALKDRDIAARGKGHNDGIDEAELLEMLQQMLRQRRDSIAMYREGNRPDLVAREEAEIAVIERFLPQPLSEADISAAVDEVIADLDASSIKDMGRVMAALKERYPGRMDLGKASAVVKQALA